MQVEPARRHSLKTSVMISATHGARGREVARRLLVAQAGRIDLEQRAQVEIADVLEVPGGAGVARHAPSSAGRAAAAERPASVRVRAHGTLAKAPALGGKAHVGQPGVGQRALVVLPPANT